MSQLSKTLANPVSPHSIGIIFTSSETSSPGRELEKLADVDSFETALAVKAALENTGYQADMVDLGKNRIGEVRKYDWIYNLAESVCGYPLADYEVAGVLEAMKMHFTGASSITLQACLNKPTTKFELLSHGILTPAFEVYNMGDIHRTELIFPLIVKPVHEDGGVGIYDDSVVDNHTELARAIERIHTVFYQAALVEEYIEGREITASILGNGDTSLSLPPSECLYPDPEVMRVLTFAANWIPSNKGYQTIYSQCPCDLEPGVEASLREIAMKVYKIMNCRDYGRVDFRLRDNVPYVLEVNPNPCINPSDSGFVRAGMAVGLPFEQLINRILECSIDASRYVQNLVLEEDPV
jgi:D-alanine-D-alanine ligase